MIIANNLINTLPKIDDISFKLNTGEVTAIIGPNGAGKSSLLKILAGILVPEQGQISLNETRYSDIPSDKRAQSIAYLAQDSFVYWPMPVRDIIALGRIPFQNDCNYSNRKDSQIIDNVINDLNLKAYESRSFHSLSGGERARVLLARALVSQSHVLLVDEPIASLDLKYQFEIMELLRKVASQGVCVVVVIHDLSIAANYCDRFFLISQGKLLHEGRRDAVLNTENIQKAFGVKVEVVSDSKGVYIRYSP